MRIEYDNLQILSDIDPSRAAAFSGYRKEKIKLTETDADYTSVRERIVRRTASAVLLLHDQGYDTFLCGMATGFDLWAGLAVLSLKNANIVRAYDYGTYDSRSFIVMEFVKGCTLKE